jgi:D-alanyl-D-alanine carboxypeptidase
MGHDGKMRVRLGRGFGNRRGRTTLKIACSFICLLASHTADAHARHHRRHPAVQWAPTPTLDPDDANQSFTGFGPTAPGVSSIVVDARTGNVVSENGADTPRYPASLTKLMTLDLAFQALRDNRMTLDTALPISQHAAAVEPVKLGLQPGDRLTVRQAILAMTTMSANDAATALGEYIGGGSEYRCAQMMTLRAHALGMVQTQFYNASGLPNPGQVTTARDLAILARDIVVNDPQDQPFFEALSFDFNGRTIYSNNGMLKLYPGAMGMKTGYTILARHNLITAAERNGTILIGVTLHEPSWGQTYTQMTALLDNGFGGHIAGGNGILLADRQTSPLANPAPTLASTQPASPYSPPVVTLPPSPGGSLFPTADAATLRPIVPAPRSTPPKITRLAQSGGVTRNPIAGWTAQLGSYSKMNYARLRALAVHNMRGMGVARIAKLDHHGKVLWAAQLAGLTQTGAHATCHALAAHGGSCVVIAPQSEHLAMRDTPTG